MTEPGQTKSVVETQLHILEMIARCESLATVLSSLCLAIEANSPGAKCSIMLFDPHKGELNVAAAPSLPDVFIKRFDAFTPSQCAKSCGTAAYLGRSVIVTDTETDPRWADHRKIAEMFGIRACWALPIFSDDQTSLGAFAMSHSYPVIPTAFHRELLEIGSHLASLAVYQWRVNHDIQKNDERYRSLIDHVPFAMYEIDLLGNIHSINLNARSMLGLGEGSQIGEVLFLNVVSPHDRDRVGSSLEKAFNGQATECEFMTDHANQPRYLASHFIPVKNREGAILFVMGIAQDVTDRYRIQAAVSEWKSKFYSVVQAAQDAIILADVRGNIIFWNEYAQKIFGYHEKEALGQPLTLLMPERFWEAYQKGLARFRKRGERRMIGSGIELAGLRKGGEEFPLELSLVTWEVAGEHYFTGIIRDMTQRHCAADALQESEE